MWDVKKKKLTILEWLVTRIFGLYLLWLNVEAEKTEMFLVGSLVK